MVAGRALESRGQLGIDPIKAGRDHHVHIGGIGCATDPQNGRTDREERLNARSCFHTPLQKATSVLEVVEKLPTPLIQKAVSNEVGRVYGNGDTRSNESYGFVRGAWLESPFASGVHDGAGT